MTEDDSNSEMFSDGAAVAEAVRAGRRLFSDVLFIGCDLSKVEWTGVTVRGTSRFIRCVFSDETARTPITEARFQNATFEWCDFRRCTLAGCSFRASEFSWCDFYRARFSDGTTFEGASFIATSLYRFDPSGSDLALSNLSDGDGLTGIVQLWEPKFREFHDRFGHVDPVERSRLVAGRRVEAIETLRTLGGHFLHRGNFVDEGEAYYIRRSLDLELARSSSSHRWRIRRHLDVAGLWLVKATCGFGERLLRVIGTAAMVVLMTAVVLWALGGIHDQQGEPASFDSTLLTALLQVAGRSPQHLGPADNWAELILVVQSLIVISLVGLFGFILANRIRSR